MTETNAHASSSRHHHKEKRHKEKHSKDKLAKDSSHKDGHKHKKKHEHHHKADKPTPFEHRVSRLRMSIPPKYAQDWLVGIREVLDGMLMRYVPQIDGVLLAHWDHRFEDESDSVKIIDECPYGVCEVQFRSVVWAPKVGERLYGTHSLSSPSHLSLLFSKTFNVSIPLQHIPQDLYKFEHTDSPDDLDSDSEDEDEDQGVVEEVGRWRNVQTGQLVGQEGSKGIKFTVIGMQVNNQVLSLTGSLLADPTNPPPPPEPTIPVRPPSPSLSPEPQQPAAKVRKISKHQKQPASQAAAPATADTEMIDERYLNPRELKQRRKEQEKKKREERKARKEDKEIETAEQVGASALVDVKGTEVGTTDGPSSSATKRKAEKGSAPEGKKKRKVDGP